MIKRQTENNRIIKNTIFLYLRMILMMVVTLYTSRVILQVLGIEDFGIFNLVAGVVILFSFLNNGLNATCQKFMNTAISTNDNKKIQKTFSISLILHFIIIIIVLFLAETIGLWFIDTQLNIPQDRHLAAIVAYQFTVLTACFSIIRVPYNASIIANEHMSFFAYSSIIEAILKLLIIWVLLLFDIDKLILYSILLTLISIIILFWNIHYCQYHFKSNKFIIKFDKKLISEMSRFSGWNLLGGISDLGYNQGCNFILNIFYGVTLNATMGIITQIRTAISSFSSNLQIAANPQIFQNYALNDLEHFKNLVFGVSKFSYFLMLIICLPILFNIEFLLNIWLVTPPNYCIEFAKMILIICMVDSLNGPLWTSQQATGKIRNYTIITSLCLLLNLPLSYIALKYGASPICILIIQLVLLLIILNIRIVFAQKSTNIRIIQYLRKVLLPIILVTIITVPIPLKIASYFSGYLRLLITSSVSIPFSLIIIYLFGLDKNEKFFVLKYIKKKFSKL